VDHDDPAIPAHPLQHPTPSLPTHPQPPPFPDVACVSPYAPLAGFLIFVDFGLGFHTGYVITFNLRKRVVMEGKQVAKWYVLRGSCWVDALSTVAWISQVGVGGRCVLPGLI